MSLRALSRVSRALRIARPALSRTLTTVARTPVVCNVRLAASALPALRQGPVPSLAHATVRHATPLVYTSVFRKWLTTTAEQTQGSNVSTQGKLEDYPISSAVRARLARKGITSLFPVQEKTFNAVFEGQDIICRSKTGSGKTLAFALPIVEKLLVDKPLVGRRKIPRCLVLVPTRELAKQVAEVFQSISGPSLTVTTVYGGSSYNVQEQHFRAGTDIVVATPGRLIDWIERPGKVLDLSAVKFCVLDEADEMLRIGFAEAVESILSNVPPPEKRQTCLWSATVPEWVSSVAGKYLRSAELIDLVSADSTADLNQTPTQVQHLAIPVGHDTRDSILVDLVRHHRSSARRILIFCAKKTEASLIASRLSMSGFSAREIHGGVGQLTRERTLADFRRGDLSVLVATDVAARGIDIPEVDLVVVRTPPEHHEQYVHRSGRTGRAGRAGKSVVLYNPHREAANLYQIQKQIGVQFAVVPPPPPAAPRMRGRSPHADDMVVNRSRLFGVRDHRTVRLQLADGADSANKGNLTKKDALDMLQAAVKQLVAKETAAENGTEQDGLGEALDMSEAPIELLVRESVWLTEDGRGALVDVHASVAEALSAKKPQLAGFELSLVDTELPPLASVVLEQPGRAGSYQRFSTQRHDGPKNRFGYRDNNNYGRRENNNYGYRPRRGLDELNQGNAEMPRYSRGGDRNRSFDDTFSQRRPYRQRNSEEGGFDEERPRRAFAPYRERSRDGERGYGRRAPFDQMSNAEEDSESPKIAQMQ